MKKYMGLAKALKRVGPVAVGGGVSEPDEERGLRAADAHARFRARTRARRGEARSRRGRSPRPTSSLPRATGQLLRLSTEDKASGVRSAPGGQVAVFGVVKISRKISPRAANIE